MNIAVLQPGRPSSSAMPPFSPITTSSERLHHRFVRQAACTPDAVAVVHAGRQITYRALDQRSNRIAHMLRGHGVGPGGRVGVCLQRCPDLVAVLLAVFKTGAAYVPLDPAYPRERLNVMLADSLPQVLIADMHDMPVAGIVVVGLDGNPALDAAPATPLAEIDDEDASALACVFYTSGSTGQPKGVMVGHSATRFIDWGERSLGHGALSMVAATTSICFDPSMFEIFATLSLGGTVILKRDLLEPFTPDERPTLLNGVSSAFAELVRENRIPDSVRVINVGGERLLASLARAIHQHADGIQLWNHYGPTETTICASVASVPPDIDGDPPIGRPIAGAVFHVLDACGCPVPVGTGGELHIGGPGVALGYLNQPALTAERFLADPFLPGGRMYRTGDMVRDTGDGGLVFLGREGRQIKLRGFRIELDEIEVAVARLAGIDAAAVLATCAPDGTIDGIKAVIATTGDWTLSILRRSLRDLLPRHMLPNRLIVLRALPLTPSGKLDRPALQRLEPPEPVALAVPDQWMSPLTEAILVMVRDILGQPAIRAQDDFFDHGGDSLLAIELMLRIETLLGDPAPICLLAQDASAAGLAGLLSRRQAMLSSPEGGVQAIALQSGGKASPLFCLAESADRPLQALALAYRLRPERPVWSLVPSRNASASRSPAARIAEQRAALGALPSDQPVLLLAAGTAASCGTALAVKLADEGSQVVLVLVAPVFPPETRTAWQRVGDGIRLLTRSRKTVSRTILISNAQEQEAVRLPRRRYGAIERIALPATGDPMREPAVSLLADVLRAHLPGSVLARVGDAT